MSERSINVSCTVQLNGKTNTFSCIARQSDAVEVSAEKETEGTINFNDYSSLGDLSAAGQTVSLGYLYDRKRTWSKNTYDPWSGWMNAYATYQIVGTASGFSLTGNQLVASNRSTTVGPRRSVTVKCTNTQHTEATDTHTFYQTANEVTSKTHIRVSLYRTFLLQAALCLAPLSQDHLNRTIHTLQDLLDIPRQHLTQHTVPQ